MARRFVWTWLGWLLGVVVILFPAITVALLNWFDHPGLRWIEEVRARKFQIARTIADPRRILIVGGSSGFFSIDAELLETKLGIPTVNLSSHGGLGLRFLLRDARKVARRGDTLLLHIEYQLYRDKESDGAVREKIERKYLWTYEPSYLLALPLRDLMRQLYGNPTSDYRESWERWNGRWRGVKSAAHPDVWTHYSYVLLSSRGDWRGRTTLAELEPPNLGDLPALQGQAVEELRAFFGWCKKRDVRVATVLPAIWRGSDRLSAETLAAMRAVQRFHHEHGIPVLGDPTVLQLPAEAFIDTHYHANAVGRRLRSESLVRELKPLLGMPLQLGERTMFLLRDPAARFHPALAFAENDSVDYRLIDEDDLGHPWTISPAQVAAMCRNGDRILFADHEIAPLLSSARLQIDLLHRETASLSDWFAAYRAHLFVLATVGTPAIGTLPDNAPPALHEFAANQSPRRAAILGTGPFATIRMMASGPEKARVRQRADRRWQKRLPFPVEIQASAISNPPLSKEASPIAVAHQPILSAHEEGVAAAVIDPRFGTVVQHGIFSGNGRRVEFQLQRVLAAPQ